MTFRRELSSESEASFDAIEEADREDSNAPSPPMLRLTSDTEPTTDREWLSGSPDQPMGSNLNHVVSPFLPGSLAEHLAKTDPPQKKNQQASIDGPYESFLASGCAKPVVLHVRSIQDRMEGSERLILNAPRFAASTYLRIAAACIYRPGEAGIQNIKSEAAAQNCPLWTLPRKGWTGWRTVKSLTRLCQRLRVNVWHSHDYRSNFIGRLISRVWKMKLVTTVHHWPRNNWRQRLACSLDRWGLRRFDQIITVNQQLRDTLVDQGFDRSRIECINAGIDTEQFQRQRDIQEARRELGVSADATVIGVVGRFTKDKGIDRAIQTLSDIKDRHENIELHLVGDGPEYNALKTQTRELGVANRVHFWGWQSPMQRFYEMMDVMLLPSRVETTPIAVLEAMSMGVPVAATKVGNVPEMLKGGRRGVLLSNRRQHKWAEHLAPLLVSANRREELGRLGRIRVDKYFSFESTMNQIMSIYDRVLSIHPGQEETEWRRAA